MRRAESVSEDCANAGGVPPGARRSASATTLGVLGVCLFASSLALADAATDRVSAGGYLRLQALTDFQGGNGRLGLGSYGCGLGGPCLYGRLLNEGPYGILQLQLNLLGDPTSTDPWASIVTRFEGSSYLGTDAGNGSLSNYNITILALEAGNILLEHVTWRVGVLWYEPGDLGLYDLFPVDLFYGVAGVSAFYKTKPLDLLIGAGDQGWSLHGAAYDTVFTAGAWVRSRIGDHLELGGGGQFGYEPSTPGNQNSPYQTPGLNGASSMTYQQFVQKDFVQTYLQSLGTTANSGTQLPNPQPRSSQNWKLVGYLGLGKLGPLKWNNFYIHYLKQPPQTTYQETYQGQTYTLYVHDLTDQMYELELGDEAQLTLIPRWLDLTVAGLYGEDRNYANSCPGGTSCPSLVAGNDNLRFMSVVARFQLYLTQRVHVLFETSVAHELSLNGNLYRQHQDSLFANDNGTPDSLGLQYGDSTGRDTWQGKWGIVFNPNGPGIFNRPSLRLLYGLQYSSAQDAFQSGYVNSLSQYNQFVGPEQHWHSVFGVEAETWF